MGNKVQIDSDQLIEKLLENEGLTEGHSVHDLWTLLKQIEKKASNPVYAFGNFHEEEPEVTERFIRVCWDQAVKVDAGLDLLTRLVKQLE